MSGLAAVRNLGVAGLCLLLPVPAWASGLCVCFSCLMGTHESFVASASSMLPAIAPEQCFIARLIAPGRYVPEPGDIVVVEQPSLGQVYVKRVVAVAGQTVQMIDGRLHVDGAPVAVTAMPDYVMSPDEAAGTPQCMAFASGEDCVIAQMRETLPNGVSYPVLDDRADAAFDNTAEETVPEGHVYLLGDNRDNSLDSRVSVDRGGFGMVPLETITGIVDDIDS